MLLQLAFSLGRVISTTVRPVSHGMMSMP